MTEVNKYPVKFVNGTQSAFTFTESDTGFCPGTVYFIDNDEYQSSNGSIYGYINDKKIKYGTATTANGETPGLSQYNFDDTYKNKLDTLTEYVHPAVSDNYYSSVYEPIINGYIDITYNGIPVVTGVKRDSSGHIVGLDGKYIYTTPARQEIDEHGYDPYPCNEDNIDYYSSVYMPGMLTYRVAGGCYDESKSYMLSHKRVDELTDDENFKDTDFETTAVIDEGFNYGMPSFSSMTVSAITYDKIYGHVISKEDKYIHIDNTWRPVKVNGECTHDYVSSMPLNLCDGSNVTINYDKDNNEIKINAESTEYKPGNAGILISDSSISHIKDTSVTPNTSYGPTSGGKLESKVNGGLTIDVPSFSFDEFGHVKDVSVQSFEFDPNLTIRVNERVLYALDENNEPIINKEPFVISLNSGEGVNVKYGHNTYGNPTVQFDISTNKVNTMIDDKIKTALTSALEYKGTVNDASKLPTTGNKTGDVYVCSTLSSGTKYYETKQNDISIRCESGDLFIWNGNYFDVVNGENQVENGNAELTPSNYEKDISIATIDGTDIIIKVPAKGSAYYTHPASINGSTSVSSSDGGDFTFSSSNKTIQVLTGVTRDASGHIGKVIYKDVKLPENAYNDKYTHPASINGSTLADSSLKSTTAATLAHEGTFTVATGVYRDASGHISKVATEKFALPKQYVHPVSINGSTLADSSLKSTTATSLSSNASFTVATGVYRDASGHISKVATETFKLPSQYSHPLAGTGSVDTPTNSSTAATLLTRVKIDSSGHVTDTTAFNGTVGGTTTPVYFNAGVPTALGYTIAKSVPSGAIFTDEKVKANTSTGKFYLIGQADAASSVTETTYKNASVYVDGSYLYSGGNKVLTSYTEQYQGTVKWVYPGTGLTNGASDSSITTTGTLNLKIASSNEIGGVKPGTTSGKTYGVQVNASTGEMTVNVPWTDNNDNTWRNVYVGGTQRLGTGVTSGSLKFVDSTNITATWNSTNNTIQFDASGLATSTEVQTAKTEAIAAATIYWQYLE